MNDDRKNRHVVDLLFVIALLFMFAFSVLMLIAIGASVYRRNVEVMAENYDSRISYAYVTEKLRQSDSHGGISIGGLDGIPALVINDRDSSVHTTTFLYVLNGYLMELTTLEGNEAWTSADAGQKITALDGLDMQMITDHLLRLELIHTDGVRVPMYLSVTSSEEDGQ